MTEEQKEEGKFLIIMFIMINIYIWVMIWSYNKDLEERKNNIIINSSLGE
jgi:hypothetical protein